jgi:hypothetical protein
MASYVLAHLTQASVVLAGGATRVDTAQRQIHIPRVLTDGSAAWLSELEEFAETGPTGDEPRRARRPVVARGPAVRPHTLPA